MSEADDCARRGEAGELHQETGNGVDALTTRQGGPVVDDQNSRRVGAGGPTLLDAAGIGDTLDDGRMKLAASDAAQCFVERCAGVRCRARE